MNYDYILVGYNINSLMIAYYLNKSKNKVLIIEETSELPETNLNLLYSNNDVNFLNFLSDLSIDFKLVGDKNDDINFDLSNNIDVGDMIFIYSEFFKEFTFDYSSKNIKLHEKLYLFSDKTVNFIRNLCNFYQVDINEISLFHFTQLISFCITNEFYTLNYNKLIGLIGDYIMSNTNIEIRFNEKLINMEPNKIMTTINTITFNKSCLIDYSCGKNKIEENILNNYLLINKLEPVNKYKIYRPDSIVDIIKLILFVKLLIK